jgi:molecular chaperone HscB
VNLHDDDFTLFGLPQRHSLDRADLDQRWRRLQGEVHPDRFAAEGAAAQRFAMQWAVRVNEAYQRLKDPLRRAAYLCELRGAPIDAERNTAMPASFMAQQMQWREALEEAVGAAEVERLAGTVARAEHSLIADLTRRLDEEGDAAGAAADVRALMFVGRFRQNVERRLDTIDPARDRRD